MAPRKTKDVARRNPEAEAMRLNERLVSIVHRLESEVSSRITKRQPLEDRWLEDLEQYHGQYDSLTAQALAGGKRSKLFINLTRPKTDAMSARLMDLLFPTDDRNWGIGPTPVPLLVDDAEKAVKALREINAQLKAKQDEMEAAASAQPGPDGQPAAPAAPDEAMIALQKRADFAREKADALREIIEEASKRADAMQAEIDDQLKASNYHAAMRDVIDDACKIGTGVCKGPVTGDKVRRGWKKSKPSTDEAGVVIPGSYQLDTAKGAEVPAMRYVDIWNFFPDMDVRRIEDGEGDFERHLMNEKRMKKLAQLPGFDKDAIRRLLQRKPTRTTPSFMARLRDIVAGSHSSVGRDCYHVYEYSGPLSAEDIRALAEAKGDKDAMEDVAELDPLTEVNAVVWFCENELLKLAPYPFDSGETLYSVFNLYQDEASIFGYGIPHVMRHPQKSLNAGWRAMMDNAGKAAGPQIIVATDLIEPENGDWTIEPNKVWRAKAGIPQDRRAFQVAEIPMYQAELANIVAISKQFIDDMTGMPSIAQGEDGATKPERTAQGTALLMNASNVTFRRIVKRFDDDVTEPNIRRFYDWNMQFSDKDEIKGDYGVDARGSSVLLVREMQAQNLMIIALQLGAHPVYGPMLKNKALLRKLFQAHMISGDEVLLTDDEIDAVLAQAAAAQAQAEQEPVDETAAQLKMEELEVRKSEIAAKIEIANMDAGTRLKVAELSHETQMMQLAEAKNMEMDKLEAMLAKSRNDTQSKERIFAAEAAMTERAGPSGGGFL
ncbi:hypothetical protein ASG43_03375 [Aureimonas sp. Leaf454]|uniref:portal protein n=1 Tax=Aureimonas sp. Leaf454 TaxID=1736381 RepID=UPI0006FE696E|nr:hypothetical protein [Aureimonas sp. Leaf454]KQT54641.1 hypothetical protein ASG43_03375 [Aureimonas sp. Leaf454]